jgi:hypothetical protein
MRERIPRFRVLRPLAEKAGIPKLNFQILRRTIATQAEVGIGKGYPAVPAAREGRHHGQRIHEDWDRLIMCVAGKRRVCSFNMAEVPPEGYSRRVNSLTVFRSGGGGPACDQGCVRDQR